MTEGMLGPVNEYTIRQHIKIYGHYPKSRNFNYIRLFNLYQHSIMPTQKCGAYSLFKQSLALPADSTHNLPFPTWNSFAPLQNLLQQRGGDLVSRIANSYTKEKEDCFAPLAMTKCPGPDQVGKRYSLSPACRTPGPDPGLLAW